MSILFFRFLILAWWRRYGAPYIHLAASVPVLRLNRHDHVSDVVLTASL